MSVRRSWLTSTFTTAPEESLRLQVTLEPCGRAQILHVRADLDAYTETRWRRLLESATMATFTEGSHHLIVDLSTAGFVSVRAVLAIAEHVRPAARRRVRLSAVADPDAITARVVEVAGLAQWLPVHADLADALTSDTAEAPPLSAATIPARGRARAAPARRPWFSLTPSTGA
ncbi:STAS domain-containing protein [Nocardia thailandica]|uniref:STAS domain-containing protein n=1 Tax=Nocardia thailandica TaxID=257275 RepID=UPI0002F4597E|nr:STAS domain-containing protein [Nocardia thailandica]